MKGFKELFGRYLEEEGPSVLWDKIKPPPEGSVSRTFMNYSYKDLGIACGWSCFLLQGFLTMIRK